MALLIKKVLLSSIDLYRLALSPYLGGNCRFTPSCSQYAKDALDMYGVSKGVYLTVRRILRCHPLHPGGYDPVR